MNQGLHINSVWRCKETPSGHFVPGVKREMRMQFMGYIRDLGVLGGFNSLLQVKIMK